MEIEGKKFRDKANDGRSDGDVSINQGDGICRTENSAKMLCGDLNSDLSAAQVAASLKVQSLMDCNLRQDSESHER